MAIGQEKKTIWSKFVNITEFGVLPGRVRYNTDTWSATPINFEVRTRLSPTIQMFNGFQIKPKTAVGLTVGIDGYNNTVLMPFALGLRQTLLKKPDKKAEILGSLDVGYGTTLLQLDNSTKLTRGGLMANPMVGYRIPNRGGSAWLINFGYKHQQATVDKDIAQEEFNSQEKRYYNRFVFRFGFQF